MALDDPLPEDESGLDIAGLLEQVRSQLADAGARRFTVTPGAVLGIFEFQRLALWSEMERLGEKGPEDPGAVAQELLGRETDAGFGGSGANCDARELEATRDRLDMPCPIKTDASQLEAVAKTLDGRSFVLEGPPGRGKSQTIANIIATQIAAGRRVLFCAEKRAAIEAVATRLERAGSMQWCLDLHGGGGLLGRRRRRGLKRHARTAAFSAAQAKRTLDDQAARETNSSAFDEDAMALLADLPRQPKLERALDVLAESERQWLDACESALETAVKKARAGDRSELERLENGLRRSWWAGWVDRWLTPMPKPCLMLSPLDAARALPEEFKVDLVVMDEASQIRPEDSVGVLARGAGHSCGRPETDAANFVFPACRRRRRRRRRRSGEHGERAGSGTGTKHAAAPADIPLQEPPRSVRRFFERAYYGGSLVTFPDPERDAQAVSGIEAGGIYEAQRNVDEAKRVAELVSGHVLGPDGEAQSIGVVTFNKKQQRLVEDLLDKARAEDPALEAAWRSPGRDAPCVRNLETAQGDERDVVVLSTTFGPDPAGRQRSHFGPLNDQGGERRLNVARTRARRRMVVVTSLERERIGTPQSPRGARDLKAFLECAATGKLDVTDDGLNDGDSVGGYDSPLEEQIAATLEARAWQLVPQVGVSGYRVDIGVVDPKASGRYLAGIEADGAQYHGSKTARDRDRLRQRVLEGKGWTLFRVWSPDWWREPEAVTERLDKALRAIGRGEKARIAGRDA